MSLNPLHQHQKAISKRSLPMRGFDFLKQVSKSRAWIGDVDDPILNAVKIDYSAWEHARESADGERILIASTMPGYLHGATLDRALAIGLTARGYKVSFLLCDANLLGCQLIKFNSIDSELLLNSSRTPRCNSCAPNILSRFQPLGLPIFTLELDSHTRSEISESLENLTLKQMKEYEIDGARVGMHAWAGTVRYFASTRIQEEQHSEAILRRFLFSAIQTYIATSEVISSQRVNTVIAHHGIYVPQGLVIESAKKSGIRCMTWTPSYRRGTFIFSPKETYHYSMVEDQFDYWEKLRLGRKEISSLKKYIRSRANGENDWIKFSDSRIEHNKTQVSTKDFFLALTSVSWDAEVHYDSRAFPNMREWLQSTVDFFKDRPDLELIIRIHPAELTSPNRSRESMVDFLSTLNVDSFSNIKLIGPENPTSTYELIRKSRVVLVYNTKTGIEAASLGVPVIVAGESWLRNKRIAWDCDGPAQYHEYLKLFESPIKMTIAQLDRARKYAYYFFFQRMVRLEMFSLSYKSNEEIIKRDLRLSEIMDSRDPNWLEILSAIEENRIPIAKKK